jgi:hypothetical protein
MENDESGDPMAHPDTPPPPAQLLGPGEPAPKLLHGGPTPAWRTPEGVLRGGPRRVMEAQLAGAALLREQFPDLADQAPQPLTPLIEHQGLCWLLEQDLGPADPHPLERISRWSERFLARRAEPIRVEGSLRALAREHAPWGLPKPSRLVAELREARRAGAALPFPPRLAELQRALDQPLQLELVRSWAHGATGPGRVLERGACHWRHLGPDHWLGVDQAPFVQPEAEAPSQAFWALLWGWRWEPERAADALVALGVAQPAPPRIVQLRLAAPHPCLGEPELERLLGTPLGSVPATAAARALGRGQGLVVAGTPLQLEVEPRVRPRRSSAPWRIRERDPTRLFSRWHQGVRLDEDARASLSHEDAALSTARRMGAETVLDAFCGAGGNAIAFARMPWCRQVIALERDPERLAMARHNAGLYGVADRIRFVLGDFFQLAPSLAPSVQACFLDPPWAAGPALALEAWSTARALISRGALKQPRQWRAPPGADALEAVFGVGPIISWVHAWWGPEGDRTHG